MQFYIRQCGLHVLLGAHYIDILHQLRLVGFSRVNRVRTGFLLV